MKIKIIGAGLAGCEAAYQLLKRGFEVEMYEMRPTVQSPAHTTEMMAELVCSNSLRSNVITNAVGLLKQEMRELDSLIMKAADHTAVAAGSALAVDRVAFSEYIEKELRSFNGFTLIREEVKEFDDGLTLVCSGPLTSPSLAETIRSLSPDFSLHFFDAVAPIVEKDSINFDICYRKSRYDDSGEGDYLNCPMTKQEFDAFYQALLELETVELREFEDLKVFEGCMPIEVMAKRGPKTLTFGPMKPVGLRKPDGTKPYAVVQLRQDDAADTLYNLVGFQTHLTWPSQKELMKYIPGLENAKIVRYGVMHRNTYLNSPKVLSENYQFKLKPNLFFAGQMTGVEGYVESAGSGLLAAIQLAQYAQGQDFVSFGNETMIGAMAHYISHANELNFQPMNANFGLLHTTLKDKQARAEHALSIIRTLCKNI